MSPVSAAHSSGRESCCQLGLVVFEASRANLLGQNATQAATMCYNLQSCFSIEAQNKSLSGCALRDLHSSAHSLYWLLASLHGARYATFSDAQASAEFDAQDFTFAQSRAALDASRSRTAQTCAVLDVRGCSICTLMCIARCARMQHCTVVYTARCARFQHCTIMCIARCVMIQLCTGMCSARCARF